MSYVDVGGKKEPTGKVFNRCYPFLRKFTVTSKFGYRKPPKTNRGQGSYDHKGIDLVGIGDINVVSCADGIVSEVRYNYGDCGNIVWVSSLDGYGMIYQHLKSISVKKGQAIKCKEKIGVMGDTGNSGGPHLHFGVANNSKFNTNYYRNEWINPALWWNMANPSSVVGRTFDGSGMITGYPSNINSTNNVNQNVNNSISSFTYSSSGTFQQFGNIYSLPSGKMYETVAGSELYGDWLYGRRYRVFIDIGGGRSLDVSDLRCSFTITKDMTSLQANSSSITIYNLNPNDENLLIKQGNRIIIEAGYEGSQYGLIFSGNVIQPLRSKENGTDYKLTLISMDADRYATYGIINISMSAQQSMRDAVNNVITRSSEEVGTGYLTNTNLKYPRGKVMFGMSKTYLAQLAKSQNSTFYIEDGSVNIVAPPDVQKNRILDFGPDSGLIGSPIQNDLGIEFDVLLNPQVKLNSLCHVDNKKIATREYSPGSGEAVRSLDGQGIYRVVKLQHIGDTRGNNWVTKVSAVSQLGMLPDAVAGTAVYPW